MILFGRSQGCLSATPYALCPRAWRLGFSVRLRPRRRTRSSLDPLRQRKTFDALRKRRGGSARANNYFASDPRYSECIVAGWVFTRGLIGEGRGQSASARDIAITIEGDLVRDSNVLSNGVFWRGELPEWYGSPPRFDNDWFNDRALPPIVKLLGLPSLPQRPK